MQENSSGGSDSVDNMATVTDPSATSGSSVLTNVAPPSALPSFLASPLPSAAPSVVPSVPPPGTSIPHPPAPSIPAFTSPATPTTTNSSIPAGANLVPSTVPCPAVPPPGTGPSGGAFVPSPAPPLLPPPPPVSLQSHTPTPAQDSDSGQAPQPPNASSAVTSQPQPPSSHSSTADATAAVDMGSPGVVVSAQKSEGPGWFGWIRGTVSNVGHRVAERAKTSMDSMITTLDPQMKEFISHPRPDSGGDVDIIVASDKEVKVGAVREAFQRTFGKATVCGMKAESQGIAAQPVGFEAALASAEGRINSLRATGHIHPQQPIVAVENFVVEFQPDCWFDLGLLLLDDPGEDILLQTYTQVTPVPPDFVNQARSATPEDYPLRDTGFAVTVGQIASHNLQVHHTMWQEALTGVSRREALVLAGRTLAGLYRSRLPNYH